MDGFDATQGDRERCLEASMDDDLTKPLDPGQLSANISPYVRRDPPGATAKAAVTS